MLDKHGQMVQIISVYVCCRAMRRTVDTIAGFQNARSLGPQAQRLLHVPVVQDRRQQPTGGHGVDGGEFGQSFRRAESS